MDNPEARPALTDLGLSTVSTNYPEINTVPETPRQFEPVLPADYS